jgi:branched-chain amino acid transport system substrate-binding protein
LKVKLSNFYKKEVKMRGNIMKKVWKGLLAATLMAGMLAGCSGGSEGASGDKKGTVKIGGIFDLTGGTGDVGTPYAEGEKAFFESIAGEEINGYKLELIGDDYAYKIPEAQKQRIKYRLF